MIDQLIIADKASFDDFGASMMARTIGQPSKKSIKETIPFSNITYDFSAINGELYWEERELEYVFEMIAPSPEKLEEMKIAFANWIMNVMEDELFDPFIFDYHFKATYSEMNFEDDEGLDKTTVSVTFTAYPFKIANHEKVYEVDVPANGETTVYILNESSHKISPKITASNTITISSELLEVGLNTIGITNSSAANCKVVISFYEEVF